MIFEMNLKPQPFKKIKEGTKTIELRLFDQKRKQIKVGDQIAFTNLEDGKKIFVNVVALHLFDSFESLYKSFDKIKLGYKKNEVASPSDMNVYYPVEEQKKFGVVGIEIELIKKP